MLFCYISNFFVSLSETFQAASSILFAVSATSFLAGFVFDSIIMPNAPAAAPRPIDIAQLFTPISIPPFVFRDINSIPLSKKITRGKVSHFILLETCDIIIKKLEVDYGDQSTSR